MIRLCKYCRNVYKTTKPNSRVCDRCKEVGEYKKHKEEKKLETKRQEE